MMLRDVIVDGAVSAEALSARVGTTQAELARSAGLGRDAVLRRARLASPTTQRRLREMAEVVARVEDWAGSPVAAYAWYRAAPLPGFGGRTAEMLVREGRADAVRRYLDEVALGGFA